MNAHAAGHSMTIRSATEDDLDRVLEIDQLSLSLGSLLAMSTAPWKTSVFPQMTRKSLVPCYERFWVQVHLVGLTTVFIDTELPMTGTSIDTIR